jgi:hypothetical protein
VPLIGSKVLGKLTASDVERMLAELRKQAVRRGAFTMPAPC